MRPFLKKIFFSVCPALRLPNDRATILMYHSVSEHSNYFSAISPEIFNKQMMYLASKRYSIISLAELLRRLRAKEQLGGAVVLTFDDGYGDNYTTVFPILKQYRFPATIFVTTDFIGKEDKQGTPHCTSEELKEMYDSGLISIEPHTLTHPKLSKLTRAEATHEIQESRQVIQSITGAHSTLFAYPYGNFNSETVTLLKEMEFIGSVTVEEGTIGPDTDVFRIPRNSIDCTTTFSQFRGKVSRVIDWYQKYKLCL